uniref:Uncharacterized protein n=1 Tax=Opuntia streptacantha TaxID=393608 RepID=A0A7C9CT66_OPUST
MKILTGSGPMLRFGRVVEPSLRFGQLSTKASRTALIPLACSLHLPSPSLLTIALSLFQSKVANGGGAQDFETAVKCVYWPSTSTHRNIKGALTFFTFCCEVEVSQHNGNTQKRTTESF